MVLAQQRVGIHNELNENQFDNENDPEGQNLMQGLKYDWEEVDGVKKYNKFALFVLFPFITGWTLYGTSLMNKAEDTCVSATVY